MKVSIFSRSRISDGHLSRVEVEIVGTSYHTFRPHQNHMLIYKAPASFQALCQPRDATELLNEKKGSRKGRS